MFSVWKRRVRPRLLKEHFSERPEVAVESEALLGLVNWSHGSAKTFFLKYEFLFN